MNEASKSKKQMTLPLFNNTADSNNFVKKEERFNNLLKEIKNCSKCTLSENRNKVVPGEGSIDTELILIGEGPGADEDREGRPFVGKAGKLLNKILKAVGIKRSEVYITNIVKCRPPGNRNPNPEEKNKCITYLNEQIKIIAPDILVCMGAVAAKTIIDPNAYITRIRGQWVKKEGFLIMPTLHPAALLRNPNFKKPVWEDFKKIKKHLN